jgi:hypothetical protein
VVGWQMDQGLATGYFSNSYFREIVRGQAEQGQCPISQPRQWGAVANFPLDGLYQPSMRTQPPSAPRGRGISVSPSAPQCTCQEPSVLFV